MTIGRRSSGASTDREAAVSLLDVLENRVRFMNRQRVDYVGKLTIPESCDQSLNCATIRLDHLDQHRGAMPFKHGTRPAQDVEFRPASNPIRQRAYPYANPVFPIDARL